MGERRGAYRVLGKRQLGRPRRRWEDSIKGTLKKVITKMSFSLTF